MKEIAVFWSIMFVCGWFAGSIVIGAATGRRLFWYPPWVATVALMVWFGGWFAAFTIVPLTAALGIALGELFFRQAHGDA